MTALQYFNPMNDLAYLTDGGDVTAWYELNAQQASRVNLAAALWDDVSNFSAVLAVDDTNLARMSTTYITEYFLGIPYNSYWENSLPHDWTRVAMADIADPNTLGVNVSYGANYRYHEVFIERSLEGAGTFQLGSTAFAVLVHELGHSFEGEHITGTRFETIMNPTTGTSSLTWHASTPMTLDIDSMINQYGASTTTRTGSDTYGFNASFSGPYRAAFDFNVNTRPLVTIYDNGGNDTLDASGFRDASGNAVGVHLDLQQGVNHASRLLGGGNHTFAIIYTTSWIENARGGAGNDEIIGNALSNVLKGEAGSDLFIFTAGDGGDIILDFNFGGARDGIDFRPFFDAIGYTGNTPRAAGFMQVLQNGADTDIYLQGTFMLRIQNVTAAAIDDSYFLFQ